MRVIPDGSGPDIPRFVPQKGDACSSRFASLWLSMVMAGEVGGLAGFVLPTG